MDDPAVVAAFLARYAADRERGDVAPLTHYQSAFPGYEALISREFSQLTVPCTTTSVSLSGNVKRHRMV